MAGEENVDLQALGDDIARTATAIDMTEHKLITLLRAFDEAGGWHQAGALSCASWLSWRTGMGKGPARERMRIGRALADLPLIDAAFAAGGLSYSKVRALTRIAKAETEATLLETARAMTGNQLEKLCRNLSRGASAEREAEPERFFHMRTTDEGMVRLTVQVTADEAAIIASAADVSAGRPGKRSEGLVAMAEEALRGDAPQRSPSEVTFHIGAESLLGESAEGAPVSGETCKRLLCDAGVVPVLEDERGKTLDVGRKTRTIGPALKRALSLRDRGCTFPGCTHQIVDGHHIHHWAQGGATKLDNLASLCRSHHRLVHEGGASIRATATGFELRDAEGALLPEIPPRPAVRAVSAENLDPWVAAATDTDAGPIDWEYATEVIAAAIGMAP